MTKTIYLPVKSFERLENAIHKISLLEIDQKQADNGYENFVLRFGRNQLIVKIEL